METHSEIEVLRQGLIGQRPVDEELMTSAAVLADRLGMLKRSSSLFEAVSFSPEVEAIMAQQLAAVAN